MPYTPGVAGQCSRIDCRVASLLAHNRILDIGNSKAEANELGPKPSKFVLSRKEITITPDSRGARKINWGISFASGPF